LDEDALSNIGSLIVSLRGLRNQRHLKSAALLEEAVLFRADLNKPLG
jgi:hypothetical protein